MSSSSDAPSNDITAARDGGDVTVVNDPAADALGGCRAAARAVRRRWLLGLTAALLLGVLAATVAWFGGPRTYESYSVLRVLQGPVWHGYMEWDSRSIVESQKRLIKSPYIVDAALSYPGVRQLPWIASRIPSHSESEWLGQQIQVRSVSVDAEVAKGNVLQISMRGDDPQQLQVLVNAVTQAYVDRIASEERQLLSNRRNMLETNFLTKQKEVKRRRELVRRIAERLGTADSKKAAADGELLLDTVLQLRKDITARRLELQQKEEALKQFKRVPGDNASQAEWDRLMSELNSLRGGIEGMEAKYKELAAKMEDLNSAAAELERRLKDLATATATANKLGLALEQFEMETSGSERVTVLQEATLPRTPLVDRTRRMFTTLAALCATGFGVVVVALWDFRARRIASRKIESRRE